MSEELELFKGDEIIAIARQAEARIDAVIKIKQLALKVTNANDWVDQDGKPYLMASGSEKIANLFNISWRIDEPTMEEEADGAITYNYKGYFSLGGRSIEVEGSRSSRDTFFKKYNYEEVNGKMQRVSEKPLDRRDLKMAAMTNLLGNGITRVLGIRNLEYGDLEQFAGIKKENVKGVKYRKPEMKEPGEKKPEGTSEEIITSVLEIRKKTGKGKTGKDFTIFTIKGETAEYSTFSETFAQIAKEAKEMGKNVAITFATDQYGNKAENIVIYEEKKEPPNMKRVINESQRKRFDTIAKGSGKSDDYIKAYLFTLGIEHSAAIPYDRYEELLTWAQMKEEPERQPGEGR